MDGEKLEIQVNHQRKAFQYATLFLRNEISNLEVNLEREHLLEGIRNMLEKKLKELKKDYNDLIQYGFDE